MTSTELTLNRTLTDILEDELYNFHGYHGCGSEHCHSSNVSLNGKSLMDLPLPAFEEFMTNETLATDYNLPPPTQNDFYVGSSSSNLKSSVTIDSTPSVHSIYSNTNSQHHQHQVSPTNHQPLRGDDFKIFNKYADPSLTTTSLHDHKQQSKVANTPVQKTVNLNSIMRTSNPINQAIAIRTHPLSSPLPRDIRVTNDSIDETDNIYASHGEDEFLGYHNQEFNFKTNWPLQDNNMALNNEDARMIFDHEFQNDDDLSDDEDDEEKTFEVELKKDTYSLPFGYSNELNNTNLGRHINDCNFVDSNVATEPFQNNLEAEEAVLDDDEDDSNMLDEDELYDHSYGKNRKESVVFNGGHDTVRNDSTPEQEPLDGRKTDMQGANAKIQTRRRVSNNTVVAVNPAKTKASSSKHLEHFHDTPSHSASPLQAHSKHKTSDGNEVYTCMITNPITSQSCLAQFSRSYDLTRHQNTIHAKKKNVFRCSECIKMLGQEGFQKTFSRLDALTRHIKSKHEYLSSEQRQDVTRYARDNIGYVVG